MWEFLDNLRKKPEHVRHQIAFFVTSGVFGLIVFMWHAAGGIAPASSRALSEVSTPLSMVAKTVGGVKNETQMMASTFRADLEQLLLQNASTSLHVEVGTSTETGEWMVNILESPPGESFGSSTDEGSGTADSLRSLEQEQEYDRVTDISEETL